LFCVANQKLGISGKKLVFEEDGTEVDDDDVLRSVLRRNGIFILLGDAEEWTPVGGIHWDRPIRRAADFGNAAAG